MSPPATFTLRSYQAEDAQAVRDAWQRGIARPAIVWSTGTGKGSSHDTPIPTPDGLRRFGDLTIGDQVYGVDGRPCAVTGVFERGTLPVHRVRFSDGTSLVVDGDHRWEVWSRRPRGTRGVLSTATLAGTDLRDDRGTGWRWRIPLTAPVVRPTADLPIPPYTLGALIANGYLHGCGAPILTTPDHDVVALVKAEHVEILDRTYRGSTCPRYRLPGIQHPIRALGLAVPSPEKFLPRAYLESSIAQRTALLRGLMDADGSSRTGGRRSVIYHTTSRTLADDMVELVTSLGGTAIVKTYDRTDEDKSVEYAVRILPPVGLHPFGTVRKEQAEHPRRTFAPRRAIVAIEPAGTAPVRCIAVDGPRGLFLIGREHLVTHNSSLIAALATDEARAGGHVLILAHRGELLTQLRDRCRAYAPDVRVGRVQAGTREHSAPIVVATVQTMARLVRDDSPRLRRPTLLICDEAHHSSAPTWEMIMRHAGCYDEESPTRALGVTATMDRAERRGLGLGDVWQEVVAERSIIWGIEHGWLVPLRGRVVVADRLDLSTVKISKTTRDYADAELGEMVAQDAPEVVKAWWTEARLPDGSHRQTAAFVPTIAAAQAYTEAFQAAGIAAELVTGKTPAKVRGDVYRRTGIYGRLADGRIQVLVSVGVLTEGWDAPVVSCVLMARPTRLDHLYQQMCGRSTRPMDPADWPRHDGTTFAPKDDALILDVVGMTRQVHLRTLVNLVPGAPYRGRPCDVCGQPRPCDCDPDDTGAEDFTREPREDTRRRLRGPADYIDVDLLGDARESGLNWLTTHPTDGYEGIPFLSAGDFYGLLWHDADGTWSGGWVTARGPHDGEWIVEGVDRQRARAAVEALELPTPYSGYTPLAELAARADDPWRLARRGPSARQLGYATSLGVSAPETLTAGACSDEIDRLRAGRRLVHGF